MAEASKRIDLAAPLLSVRRHGGLGGTLRYGERGDDATPGGVPFGWERRPGHPKGVCTTQSAPPLPGPDQEAAVRFSDALSRPDSCYTVSCSDAAGATVSASASAAPSPRGSVMMDRFLLAAKEQCVFRKAAAAAAKTRASHRLPERLPVQHLPASHVQRSHVKDTDDNGEEEEEDKWEVHSTAGFASKRKCGLLPARCARSALLLLNPARSTMRRRRRGARRLLSGCGSSRRETNPLLPRIGHQHPDHDAGTVTRSSWEEVYISSLRRSDRGAVHPKATHLGLLLVLDRADGGAASPLPPPNPKCGRPPTAKANVRGLNAVGQGFPPPLPPSQERTVARRDDKMVLALPSPKTPSESWLSRTLPTVSSNRLPATSFMGLHVQQLRNQRAASRWCSSDQAKVVDHGARGGPRQIRIYDLHK
ncbi:uncharacterized protein [Aegilops tauschii subsp. strangulata]|uniref:Uncharacterized protein n=2 Tax=Triticinae TaxID=1648030 RepID=A0A452ZJK8_AEGTS|nr:uncharacterized protein LOC109767170 isoform X1 [Aegilops tauschii subsp. strangulata]XP_044445641.1 uncharacterized protein LOC123172792 [Triticum aestivum]